MCVLWSCPSTRNFTFIVQVCLWVSGSVHDMPPLPVALLVIRKLESSLKAVIRRTREELGCLPDDEEDNTRFIVVVARECIVDTASGTTSARWENVVFDTSLIHRLWKLPPAAKVVFTEVDVSEEAVRYEPDVTDTVFTCKPEDEDKDEDGDGDVRFSIPSTRRVALVLRGCVPALEPESNPLDDIFRGPLPPLLDNVSISIAIVKLVARTAGGFRKLEARVRGALDWCRLPVMACVSNRPPEVLPPYRGRLPSGVRHDDPFEAKCADSACTICDFW
jgi:hypothetical protein